MSHESSSYHAQHMNATNLFGAQGGSQAAGECLLLQCVADDVTCVADDVSVLCVADDVSVLSMTSVCCVLQV